MGVGFSANKIVSCVADYVAGVKRKREYDEDEENQKVIDIALHTPKRKKLHSTTKYIYQALFEEGKNSDITVCALDEEFHLHKIYLSQSPYFASMFGGSWNETTKTYINIEVVDPVITVESLRVVFGSLYDNEIILNPLSIVPILATATMFQLETLIEKCCEVMLETINPKTSLDYYNAACQYGVMKLQEVCFKWFLVNLMTHYFSHPLTNLKTIPIDLMEKLILHPDLFVMQTEYSIYVMLKYWMYLRMNDDHPTREISSKSINLYFSAREGSLPFLLSNEGKKFAPAFRGLRLHNLLSQKQDIELIFQDNIIPQGWINPVVMQKWQDVLRVDQNEDKGPNNLENEFFLHNSLRCGRILRVKERHVWRWTGFHFGMDLIMFTDGAALSIKRNNRSEYSQLLSSQITRYIVIRVTVVKLNEQGQVQYSKGTEILKIALTKGEEYELLRFDENLEYPIIISANIQYTSPDSPEETQLDTSQVP